MFGVRAAAQTVECLRRCNHPQVRPVHKPFPATNPELPLVDP